MAGLVTHMSVMIQMNLTALRREIDAMSWFWTCVGGLLALGTLSIPFAPELRGAALVDVLALAFGAWLLMMMVAPIFGGGSGIRAEHLALLPVPPRQLAVGLLSTAAVGLGPAVLLLAFASLVVYGFQLGLAAGLISILMALLQFIMVLLLGCVVYGLMGQAMRTRLGMELVAFQFGLLFASFSVGWFAIEPVMRQTERLLTDGLPPLMSGIVRALPSGWGLLAVEAAGRADWLSVIGLLLAFAALIGGLLWAWSALLARNMLGKGTSRIGRGSAESAETVTARTPLEGVIFKEWKMWMRDPWRALEFRTALWTGVFTGLIPLVVGLTEFMPFAGIVMVVMGGMGSANLYGLDGSALWQTLLTPGAERLDVRGRQWAWLRLFGPASLVVTVIFTALSGQTWAWPVVLGVLPAMLGGVAGLMMLLSVFMPSPGIDPQHRRNPMDSSGGDITGPFLLLFLAGVIAALPAWIAFNGMGVGSENPLLQWAGVPVGILIGVALAWGCGLIAYKRLETSGAELLNRLLKGTTPVKAKKEEEGVWKEMSPKDRILVSFCQSLFWLPLLPQGLVPMGFKLAGLEEKSWFVALYLPEPLQWPVIFVMIALGAWMLYIAIEIPRRYKRQRAGAQEDGG